MFERWRRRAGPFFLGDAVPPPLLPEGLRRGLARALLTTRPHARAAVIALGAASTVVGLVAPWMQKRFVDGILHGAAAGALALTMGIAFVSMFLAQALMAACRAMCVRESTLAQRWLSEAVYEHTLSLDSSSRHARTVGETVTIYAQDVLAVAGLLDDVVPNAIASLLPLVAAPVAIALAHDIPVWPPILVSALSVGTCLVLSRRQARYFGLTKVYAEKRLSIVNEWLQNMRAIRVLGWLPFFEDRIRISRVVETRNRLAMVTNGSTMNSVAQVAPFLVNVAGVLTFLAYSKVAPTPGDIFSMLWIFGVFLVRPIRMLPWAIVVALDASTSARRLEEYFRLSREPEERKDGALSEGSVVEVPKPARAAPVALRVEGLTLRAGDVHLLHDITFSVERGELVALVGEVGSGKSLLLQSLLRETGARFSRYEIEGADALAMTLLRLRRHFGYVPQDSFVMSATLRDNVSFEYDARSDPRGVLESLHLADFAPGAENLDAGLETEIGERGVNLSGGQRQRVNLARAHFHGREILLLDDCLSALDVETEERVRKRLLQGAWRNRTRLLVTHRLSILPHCDRVLFLEDGMIKDSGTFEALLETSPRVRDFVRSVTRAAAKTGAPV